MPGAGGTGPAAHTDPRARLPQDFDTLQANILTTGSWTITTAMVRAWAGVRLQWAGWGVRLRAAGRRSNGPRTPTHSPVPILRALLAPPSSGLWHVHHGACLRHWPRLGLPPQHRRHLLPHALRHLRLWGGGAPPGGGGGGGGGWPRLPSARRARPPPGSKRTLHAAYRAFATWRLSSWAPFLLPASW